jgi:acetyl esterase/lipase/lysophospholipase L1-like esterase
MHLKNTIYLLLWSHFLISQEVIPLYSGVPVGSEDWTWSEQVNTQNLFNTEVVYNVVQPTITAYLPPYYLATGTAVIIAPGGGFHTLSINSEGTDVAKWLNSKGVAAFVLKYRLTRSLTDDPVKELMGKMSDSASLDRDNEKTVPLAMADALAAIKYVRDHSGEMDIDPNKIGIMGFSAGGTLAMSVAYNASEQSRPNFVAPIYLYGGAIIGSEIPSNPTPIFVAVAGDDQLGLLPHSLNIYKKWFDAGQPAELHVYQKGGHGFGMRTQDLPTDSWYERFGEWLHLQGYLKKLYPNKYEKLYGQDAVARGKIERVAYLMKDYASMSRYQDANANLLTHPPKGAPIVFLGNSITDAWPNVDSLFFAQNNFIGRGISAQTSAQLLLRFRQDVIDLHPKAVVIHIGTNDVAENTGPYDPLYTMSNIQSMVDLARANNIKAIICSVLPATKFEWNRALGDRSDMILDLNQRLKSYADQQQIAYIDYHGAMKNDKNGMDPDIAQDGVHPTLKGYKIMEKLVLEKIKSTLK